MGLKRLRGRFLRRGDRVHRPSPLPRRGPDPASREEIHLHTRKADRAAARASSCTPRSFLDAGTEVQPGERKFTDYAFPPSNVEHSGRLAAVINIGGRRRLATPNRSWRVPGICPALAAGDSRLTPP